MPVPPAAFQVIAMPSSPLLTSSAELPHSSLSSATCVFPLSASSMPATESSMHCMHRVLSALHSGVSAHPQILTGVLVRVLVHSSGHGSSLFTCFSSVCMQIWSPHLRKVKRECKKVWSQAVIDAQRCGNRLCSEQACRLGLFSLEEGYRVEEEIYKIMSGPERMGRIGCLLCLLTQPRQLLLP